MYKCCFNETFSPFRINKTIIYLYSDPRETRLTEAVDNICERILQYNVHAERPGSLRYAKVTYIRLLCKGPTCITFV